MDAGRRLKGASVWMVLRIDSFETPVVAVFAAEWDAIARMNAERRKYPGYGYEIQESVIE